MIALGGFMGVGKTTLGRALAQRLDLDFADLDQAIESREGCSVAEIFREQGEPAFRALEAQVLAELVAAGVGVVALGGGTLHQAACRRVLEGHRVLVLRLEDAALRRRLAELDDHEVSSRPLMGEAWERYLARRAGYRSAGEQVDLTGLTLAQALDRLERHVREVA